MNIIIIRCKVITKSSQSKIIWDEGYQLFKVYIFSLPEKGKANQEICKIISKKLSIPIRNIVIQKGFTTTIKEIAIMTQLEKESIYKKLSC
jgi:uncharacterized protein YggU (UPF0235/DUF167 family)